MYVTTFGLEGGVGLTQEYRPMDAGHVYTSEQASLLSNQVILTDV